MNVRKRQAFTPFASRGRHTVIAILATIALSSAIGLTLSIWATSRSQHRTVVLEMAARQRTLAATYVGDVLLVREGYTADPAYDASLLTRSAHALLDGGTAPSLNGDDDETSLPPTTDRTVRLQLEEEQRLITDLTATGRAILAHQPVAASRRRRTSTSPSRIRSSVCGCWRRSPPTSPSTPPARSPATPTAASAS